MPGLPCARLTLAGSIRPFTHRRAQNAVQGLVDAFAGLVRPQKSLAKCHGEKSLAGGYSQESAHTEHLRAPCTSTCIRLPPSEFSVLFFSTAMATFSENRHVR